MFSLIEKHGVVAQFVKISQSIWKKLRFVITNNENVVNLNLFEHGYISISNTIQYTLHDYDSCRADCRNADHLDKVFTPNQTIVTPIFKRLYWLAVAVTKLSFKIKIVLK